MSLSSIRRWSLWLISSCIIQVVVAQQKRCSNGTATEDCGSSSRCITSVCTCNSGYSSASGSNCERLDTSCHTEKPDCYDCEGSLCVRCVRGYSVVPSDGSCTISCSSENTVLIFSKSQGIEGKFWGHVCQAPSSSESGSLSTTIIVVIVIVIVLLLIVIAVIVFVLVRSARARGSLQINSPAPSDNSIMMRTKAQTRIARRESRRISKEIEAHVSEHVNKGFVGDNEEAPSAEEVDEFMKRLSELRDNAVAFLTILNDMRRRLKTLQSDAEGTKQCKKVIRDLSRLLFILNKKPQSVQMPPDGLKLLTWAEHILTRYKVAQPGRVEDAEQSGPMNADDIEAQIGDDSQ
ncbi:uncharacterized protein LOC134184505 [Corticium candelabrum]|uniref:uncharacterized protein LOC134184505 n=1 Tax=Corticium candelabrum TaxID=121492 RepID=UPI002E315ECE|nr:uncharacterized protein LOC134184505 [Corticium candelabrum]